MRRAILVALILAATLVTSAAPARAQGRQVVNGIGLVDYNHKPDFKVGDWARYHMRGNSELGAKDDYTVTLLIAGEEDFWGDRAFWLETWVEGETSPTMVQAALMSYDIFNDPSATERLMLYMRKAIQRLNEDGTPRIEINKPAASILKTRRDVKNPTNFDRDTVGVDTVQTPAGSFRALKVVYNQGKGVTQSVGDSTMYTELRETRTSWYVNDIPITHMVREDVETSSTSKSWLTGRSGDALKLNVKDRALGTARLIAYGHGGLTARVLPEKFQHSIEVQAARERAAEAPAAPRTGTKPRR